MEISYIREMEGIPITNTFPHSTKDIPSFTLKQVEQRVVLNYVSILGNSNKFYIMEFHEGLGECSYRIYTEYGRMGGAPRKHERFYKIRFEAKKEFERILSSKRKKGYVIIILDEEEEDFHPLPFRTRYQGKMNAPVSETPSISIQTKLGKLSEIQLHRGLQILTEIEERLSNHTGERDLLFLSNQFYSAIPVVFGSRINREYLLDSLEKVEEKKECLKQMLTAIHHSFPG